MQNYFYELSETLFKQLTGDEQLLLNFEGEDSDFVRLNNNKVRQAGCVSQRSLYLDLIEGKRHAEACIELAGDMQQDIKQLTSTLKKLREQRAFLPEDPYLSFATEINNTEYHHDAEVINSHAAIEQILQAGRDLDLVGIFANGSQYVGFANSMGQRNWHSSANFNFDWSCYLTKDKAVKSNYAGFDWQQDKLLAKIKNCKRQLAVLAKPAKTINPGSYRAYLAPSAVEEIMGMLSWGGFGLKSHRTKSTPLIQMLEQDPSPANTPAKKLSSSISLREHHARGLAPVFTDSGFIKPEQVQLIKNGHYKDCLVNPRSAMEYSSEINAGSEYPCALDLAAGDLAEEKILSELGTGLYINNLWYLNFSDRNACQLTGMTRFACFWVENGEIQAPLNVMRFDDSIYDLFGTNLLGLTTERELILDSSTYGQRSNSSLKLPGVLVKDMCFTL
ncbi:MAG: metallopeptidase TldD-related protein [Gammaproteobacteria bacterium]|nr:metallopeptidase TldD-related protein [Gammaproteobacteria bacterium]